MKSHFLIGTSLTICCYSSFAQDAQHSLKKDIATIRNNFFTAAQFKINPSDKNIDEILKLVNNKGQFNDIKYGKVINFFEADKHLNRLALLTSNYTNPKSKYYNKVQLRTKIFSIIRSWCKLNATSPNWWCRDIGYPKRLAPTVIKIYKDVSQHDLKLRQEIADYFINNWHRPIRSESNSAQIGKFALLGALYDDRPAIVKEVSRQVKESLITKHYKKGRIIEANLPGSSTYKTVHELVPQEGVLADNMYNAHGGTGSQLYWGGYGAIYLDTVMWFKNVFKDTQYSLNNKEKELISNFYLDSINWIIYNKTIDFNNIGRRWQDTRTASSFYGSLENFIPDAPQRYKKDLEKTLIRFKEGKTDDNYVTGNREFWNFDYIVHRRKNYAISARMTSKRTVCNESGLGGGEQNYYTGSGVTYIKTTGKEYTYDLAKAWNWRKLPGITALQDDKKLPVVNWGNNGKNGNDFAVTVSDGKNGFAAFKFDRYNVVANKAYFFFDEGMLALGNSINIKDKNNKYDVFTTVNQCLLNKNTLQTINNKTILHDNVAYISLSDDFNLTTQENLEAKASTNVSKGKNVSIFTLGFNHSNQPNNSSYQYFVAPNINSKEQLKTLDTSKIFKVLRNNENIQVVSNNKDKLLMFVVYKAGTYTINTLTLNVSMPLAFTVKLADPIKRKIDFYVSNPFGWKSSEDSTIISIQENDSKFNAKVNFGKELYRGQTVKISTVAKEIK